MPFQSEKQRRYLWANEPEIARDWTDTYGSGIAKALGGRIPFATGLLSNLYDSTLGKHFDNTGNLRAATRQGLISEPQYKTMSGYDASQTIPGITDNPVVTGATSGAYNIAKSIFSPQDYFNPDTYQPQIGPIDSTVLNTLGSLGLSPQDKEKYEGITSLDPKSLGMGQWAQEDLYDFSGVDDDDEPGTIAFDPNNPQVNKAGLGVMSFLSSKFGPKIAAYLRNRALTKIGKTIGPKIKKTGRNIFNPPKTPVPPGGAGWQSPSGRDHASTAGIGSAESKQGPAGGSVGASRFR